MGDGRFPPSPESTPLVPRARLGSALDLEAVAATIGQWFPRPSGKPTDRARAERVCVLRPKGRVVERVTHWEEGKAVAWRSPRATVAESAYRWVTRIEATARRQPDHQKLEYAVKFDLSGGCSTRSW